MTVITDRNDPEWKPLTIDHEKVEEALFAVVVDAEGMVTIDVRSGVHPRAVAECLHDISHKLAEGGGLYVRADGVDEAEKFANGASDE